jgi:formylglycine-generating enzyme required for sulfatase activity
MASLYSVTVQVGVSFKWIAALIASVAVAVGSTVFAEESVRQAGQIFRDCSDCPEMVVIPPGSFLMGASTEETARDLAAVPHEDVALAQAAMAKERPQHMVTIDRPFAMGRYHVTRGEFTAFVRETAYPISGGCYLFANHKYQKRADAGWRNPGFVQTERDPVVCTSWNDAQAYTAWLNGKLPSDGRYRLPTEAEWEYAARAGTRTARWWGDSIGSGAATCAGCGSEWDGKQTAPVGGFRANPFGLFDVLGNAMQWTQDCWNDNYAGAPADGSAWTSGKCERRVLRGGDFANRPWILRSDLRTNDKTDIGANYVGFRVAKTLP